MEGTFINKTSWRLWSISGPGEPGWFYIMEESFINKTSWRLWNISGPGEPGWFYIMEESLINTVKHLGGYGTFLVQENRAGSTHYGGKNILYC